MGTKLINKFFGGITRDEKSKQIGVCSNVEEIDILENADYIQPAQRMSAEASMPATTEVFSYTADNSDVVFGYGRETAGSKVRIVSASSGGSSTPGNFSTLFTAAAVLYYDLSPVEYHRCSTGDVNRIYWLSKSGSVISLNHCTTTGTSETLDGILTGIDGTDDRLFMRRIYGELYIGNGQYISRVDKDGSFTEKAFTLPNGWEGVDLCEAGNSTLILARNISKNHNISKGYFWDLTSSTQFDDSFDIPFGGPQWLIKHRETIKIMCAINGEARFYQVSAYAGGVPAQLPGMSLKNVMTEASTLALSSQRMVAVKDDIIYFSLYKTDKSGIYAIGQIDNNKNYALYLAKRFATTNYSLHIPRGLYIQGPNFYCAFTDNGTASNSRCATLNSPTRSSLAVYETVVLDDDNPTIVKKLKEVGIISQPNPNSSCAIAVSVDPDYSGTYTAINQADNTNYNITGQTVGIFEPKVDSKVWKIKISWTSSGTTAIKLTGLFWTALQEKSTAKTQQ